MKKKLLSRKFLGEIVDLKTERDPVKRNFNKAHIKAYIAGKRFFKFGYTTLETGQRVPAFHPVEQEYYYI